LEEDLFCLFFGVDENVRTVIKNKSYEEVLRWMKIEVLYAGPAASVIEGLLTEESSRNIIIRSREVNNCLFSLLKKEDNSSWRVIALEVLSSMAQYGGFFFFFFFCFFFFFLKGEL